jgi:hypothetical protein
VFGLAAAPDDSRRVAGAGVVELRNGGGSMWAVTGLGSDDAAQ